MPTVLRRELVVLESPLLEVLVCRRRREAPPRLLHAEDFTPVVGTGHAQEAPHLVAPHRLRTVQAPDELAVVRLAFPALGWRAHAVQATLLSRGVVPLPPSLRQQIRSRSGQKPACSLRHRRFARALLLVEVVEPLRLHCSQAALARHREGAPLSVRQFHVGIGQRPDHVQAARPRASVVLLPSVVSRTHFVAHPAVPSALFAAQRRLWRCTPRLRLGVAADVDVDAAIGLEGRAPQASRPAPRRRELQIQTSSSTAARGP